MRRFALLVLWTWATAAWGAARPHILWIIVEDMSCDFGYQGQARVRTPAVDRLAHDGTAFTRAYVTAPVCSASRSALITGMYQTTIGAHHHRSGRGTETIHLPSGIRTIPELFREAGYYTCNVDFRGGEPPRWDRPGKEDYNFVYQRADLYDGTDWSGRAPGQPFFAQIQLHGGKLRHGAAFARRVATLPRPVTADQVTLPPYYPDVPAFREDWAAYLNTVQITDREVGWILARLEREGILDRTAIFFITDHGISQARGKQFLYEEGVRIPLVVRAPGRVPAGATRDDPVVHIDLAATSLAFAGIALPPGLQARPLFGTAPRPYVICARDRCDETVDRIRSVIRGDLRYLRNFYPDRPYLQPCAYKDAKPWMPVLRALDAQGKLNATQSLVTAPTRPEEELYDLRRDPWQVHNLATDPVYRQRLRELRGILANWVIESDDRGRFPEPAAMYDSDMKVYVDTIRRKKPDRARIIEANIRWMKQRAAAGH